MPAAARRGRLWTLFEDRAAAREVVALGLMAAQHGLVDGTEGNASIRRGDALYVTTPGAALATLSAGQVARVDGDAVPEHGPRPSKDVVVHRVLYREHPSATAVLHLHGRYIAAFCALREARMPVMGSALPLRVALPIPMLPYAEPRIAEREERYVEAAQASPVLLERNHGIFVAAEDAASAVEVATIIEANLRCFFTAAATGREIVELTPQQVARLQRTRELMRRVDGLELAQAAREFGSRGDAEQPRRASS